MPPDPLPPDAFGEADVVLRPAEPVDARAVAAVHLEARAAAPMPAPVHSDEEVRAWLAGRLDVDEVWVAEASWDDGQPTHEVVGYVRLTPTWLDDLYVAPAWAGQGVGSALLRLAMARRPEGFGLWVFEMNTPARAFYARHGLVEVRRTDGSENEERCPDVEVAWRPEMSHGVVGGPEPF